MEITKLAFSGGGIKGISYIGVFKKIEELIHLRKVAELKVDFNKEECKIPIFNIKTVCGVSVGSIFSLIYLLKFSYVEMLEEILNKNFQELKDIRIFNFISKYGLDDGNLLIKWIQSLMKKKDIDPNITFKEFYEWNNVDFQVMATNLNKYCYKKFNYIETPDIKVVDAIRMSISIPFLFTINKYENEIYVDGGLIDNYPIKVFDNLDNFLGFKLVNHGEMCNDNVNESIDDIENYIYHILSCYMVQKEKHTTRNDEFRNCTVYINTKYTQSINFKLSLEEKYDLINIGYDSLDNFFKNYFIDKY